MRVNIPEKVEKTVTITKFLLLPKTLLNCHGDKELRWLCTVRFKRHYYWLSKGWEDGSVYTHDDVCWLDDYII